MVEEHLENGKRIAQLLASELEGLETGPLAAVAVVDADIDAGPGDVAYRIARQGTRIGAVELRPEAAAVSLKRGWPSGSMTDRNGLRRGGDTELIVEHGAASKRAVDALRDALS